VKELGGARHIEEKVAAYHGIRPVRLLSAEHWL
jgi:hypothetical protein